MLIRTTLGHRRTQEELYGRAKAEVGGAKCPPEGRGTWVRLSTNLRRHQPCAPSSHGSQSFATGFFYQLSHAALGTALYHNNHEKSTHGVYLELLQPLSELSHLTVPGSLLASRSPHPTHYLLSPAIFMGNLEDCALNVMAEDQPVCKAWP